MLIYPRTRLRRNKKAQWCRNLFAEHNITVSDLIMPLFVVDHENFQDEISTMKGIFRYGINNLTDKVKSLYDSGICAIMLFPYIDNNLKTNEGSEALNHNNLICRAISKIKQYIPNVGVIADVALDPYTSHGCDGVLDEYDDVHNDNTVKILCQQALVLADAGVDAVSPSDMMDGRIGAIRDVLESAGHSKTQILSYAVKYSSNFYSPFRDAVGSRYNLGNRDKKTYFSDYRNRKDAMTEIALDISEGADAIIIKPGMMYLDILYEAYNKFSIPLIAYQVSGEYSMLKNAAIQGIINEKEAVLEVLHCFKRAGAKTIITYYADEIVEWIK